tara:strand:+ start:284 stop:508 length:225 start_codon:yes stop_codon:yes gene_type:complete
MPFALSTLSPSKKVLPSAETANRNRSEHLVTVTADGFDWQGRPYKSLSAIARAITGTRWNGWVFFGLKNHRRGA